MSLRSAQVLLRAQNLQRLKPSGRYGCLGVARKSPSGAMQRSRNLSSSSIRRNDDEEPSEDAPASETRTHGRRKRSSRNALATIQDDEWNIMRDLQSLHGPHVDEYLQNFLGKVQREDMEFEVLLGKLGEAFQLLERQKESGTTPSSDPKAAPPAQEAASKKSETSSGKKVEGEIKDEEVRRKVSEMEERHQQMTPAERVVDLIDRLSLAGQPLLQRMIHSEDKDLDQLLAELDADENARERGLPAPQRPLVQSPNTLPVGRLDRTTARSPTHALIRGQDPNLGANELQKQLHYNQDDEEAAKNEMIEWMKRGEKIRQKGGGTMLSPKERKKMVAELETLMEQARLAPQPPQDSVPRKSSAPLSSRKSERSSSASSLVGIPTQEMTSDSPANILQPAYLPTENWFTTTPSIGLKLPSVHPRTHSIPVASLHFRSFFPHLLDFQTHFVLHTAYALGIPVSKPAHLPTKRTLVTVLRSPFVHKKSQENWERKTHKRAIKVWDCDKTLLEGWLKYLESHGVSGVGMRTTRWEWVPMDFMQDSNVTTKPPISQSSEDEEAVKDLASRLVKDLEAQSSTTAPQTAGSSSVDASTLLDSNTSSTTTIS